MKVFFKLLSTTFIITLVVACGGGGGGGGAETVKSKLQGTWYSCFDGYLEELTFEDNRLTFKDYEAENSDCTGALDPYDIVIFSLDYGDSFRDDNNFTALEVDTTVIESSWDAYPVGETNYDIVGVEKGCLLTGEYDEFFNGESTSRRPINLDSVFPYGTEIKNNCFAKFLETETLGNSAFNDARSGTEVGELEPAGANFWEFELEKSGSMEILSFDSEFDPECALVDESGTILDQNDDFGDSTECRVSSTLAPGRYVFVIIGFERDEEEFGEYNLGFEFIR